MSKLHPQFPNHHGEPLPQVLKPWRLDHYWKLFLWIYYQPSHLKQYLYQADPELYFARGWVFWRAWRLPAYRNLVLMSLLLTISLSGVLTVVTSAVQGTPVDWNELAFGVAGGVVFGVAFSLVRGVTYGVTYGVAFGVAGGVAGGMAFGVAGGVAGGLVFGTAFGLVFGVAGGLAVGVVVGVAFSMAFGLAVGVAVGVAFGIGATRTFDLILQIPLVIIGKHAHPVQRSELSVWPIPYAVDWLQNSLQQNSINGWHHCVYIAANPFQRGTVQKALIQWLAPHPNYLFELWHLSKQPRTSQWLATPDDDRFFKSEKTANVILFAMIANQYKTSNRNDNELVWRLTSRLRQVPPSPLAAVARLLSDLCEDFYAEQLRKETVAQLALTLDDIPHSAEVVSTFALCQAALMLTELAASDSLQAAFTALGELPQPLLRPASVEALIALGDINREIVFGLTATSVSQQSAALNRANGALEQLEQYVLEQVIYMEQILFTTIIDQWGTLITNKQGELGRQALSN
ncbi:MAG: hypothetical protein ACPG8W_14445 [Candidatus Promineifilaceae bacterium]